MKRTLTLIFCLLVCVAIAFSQTKLFAITGDETSITITFPDTAAKQVFLDALAARGSYREQLNDKGEISLTKEDFVFNELTQFFGDAILQQRVRAAVESAVATVPKEDIPTKKSPKTAVVKIIK